MVESTALQDLTARVERLERLVSEPRARPRARTGSDPEGAPDGGPFWALEALRARTQGAGAVVFTGSVRLPTGEHLEWQQGTETDALLEDDWTVRTDVLAALGHPARLLLLREVLRGMRTAAELGSVEGLGTSGQVYHHVRQLVAAGWLRSAGRGRFEVPAARVVPLLVVIATAAR
ncbi:MAG TPA: ArsR family transcriptional regulator [Mycobacteriales bacterium]|nr:ArsR family transcriptional regulator [Mycobacteriales bacterium]